MHKYQKYILSRSSRIYEVQKLISTLFGNYLFILFLDKFFWFSNILLFIIIKYDIP